MALQVIKPDISVGFSKLNLDKKLSAPTLQLQGHEGAVYALKFNDNGDYLASAGHDRLVYVWDVFSEQVTNLGVCKGHKNAVLDLCWEADSTRIHTASADSQLITWDTADFSRVRTYKGHQGAVNGVDRGDQGSNLVVSASDDCTVKLWDLRDRKHIANYQIGFQITSVQFSKNNDLVFFAGIDNSIRALNIKANRIEYSLLGHTDTVTGISLSPSGTMLLSNAMDSTVRRWDVRPYCPDPTRAMGVYGGASHNFEKNLLRCCWSADESLISAGSADRATYVWRAETGEIKHKLGGHTGSVNATALHPTCGTIIASGSSDKTVCLGHLEV